MNTYSVYCHIFPNGKRYVGITRTTPEKRWANGHGYQSQPLMWSAIEKYGWSEIEHKVLYTDLSKEEAEAMEVYLIAKWDLTNRNNGYNLGNGGSSPGRHSEETKQKISEGNKGEKNGFYGKHHSLKTKQILKEKNSNKPSYWQGKERTIETKEKIRKTLGTPVNKYSKDGVFICSYNSINEAAEDNIHAYRNGIRNCCEGKRRFKTSGGFIWKYKEGGNDNAFI